MVPGLLSLRRLATATLSGLNLSMESSHFDVVLPGTRTAEMKHTRAIGIQNVDALRVRAACTRCPTASSDDLLGTRNVDVLYTRASGIGGSMRYKSGQPALDVRRPTPGSLHSLSAGLQH